MVAGIREKNKSNLIDDSLNKCSFLFVKYVLKYFLQDLRGIQG